MEAQQTWPLPQDNTLLIVDDDRAFLARLARAMETRGFEVETAPTVEEGLSSLRRRPPAFAVVDMRLDGGSGIDVIAALKDVATGPGVVPIGGPAMSNAEEQKNKAVGVPRGSDSGVGRCFSLHLPSTRGRVDTDADASGLISER